MYYEGEMNTMHGVDGVFATIMIVYLLIIGVALIGALIDFVIRGFGMYKMGKAQGKTNSWLAFIPYARTYFQGELSGNIALKNKTIKNPGVWLLVVPIVSNIIIAFVVFIFWIVSVVSVVSARNVADYTYDMSGYVGAMGSMIVFLVIIILLTVAVSAVTNVLKVLVNRQIYQNFTTTNMAIIHAVLGIFIPFYESACMLIFGRRVEASQEPQDGYYQPEDTTIE